MDAAAEKWRELFLEVVEPHRDVPIYLSGGVDSATILAAQLASGGKPKAYVLSLGGTRSGDVKVALSMVDHFGLDHSLVVIPRSEEVLVDDVRRMIRLLGTTRKTAIQNGQCTWHLGCAAAADGHSEAMTGTGGVSEDCRAVWIILHRDGEKAAREFRRGTLFRSAGDEMDGTKAMHAASAAAGVELIEPYSTQPFADYSLSLDMAEIHKPVQKGIALRAFPEFWTAGSWYRSNKSMQVESGIREWHDTLLASRWNRRRGRAVLSVYNDIRSEMND